MTRAHGRALVVLTPAGPRRDERAIAESRREVRRMSRALRRDARR
ncbi:MAG TPA: hypothetical protein VGP96_01250 [Candidatus Dormibacteraeota bacterium]|nr:hypothetical protein [Candidatus Dormibacteraeota bacterium]